MYTRALSAACVSAASKLVTAGRNACVARYALPSMNSKLALPGWRSTATWSGATASSARVPDKIGPEHKEGARDPEGRKGAEPRSVLPGRGRKGHERAEREPGQQPSDVRRVVDSAVREAVHETVQHERPDSGQVPLEHHRRRRELAEILQRDECARGAKNRPRCAHRDLDRVDEETREVAGDTAQQINERKRRGPDEALRQPPQCPQRPSVEGEMHQATVEKHGGHEPPALPVQRERSEVRAPDQELAGIRVER